jgi:hypothetical protein
VKTRVGGVKKINDQTERRGEREKKTFLSDHSEKAKSGLLFLNSAERFLKECKISSRDVTPYAGFRSPIHKHHQIYLL